MNKCAPFCQHGLLHMANVHVHVVAHEDKL